jgi:hypothetical protein
MALALSAKTDTRLDCHDVVAGQTVAVISTSVELDEFTELLTNNQINVKGKDVYIDLDPGSKLDDNVIGEIDTEYPLGNVVSLLRSGMLQASEHDAAPKPSSSKKKPPKPPAPNPESLPTKSEKLADKPEEQTVKSEESEKTGPTIDPSFEGLDPAIALVLIKQEITTKDLLLEYIAEGGKLADLDEIGRSRVEKLNAWLGS